MNSLAGAYRGNVEISGPALVRGWCASMAGEPGRVSLFVNDAFKCEFAAPVNRKDLDQVGVCKTGGGFEVDIASFLEPFGISRVRLADPFGTTLPMGEFTVDYRAVVRGEFDHLFRSDGLKIGLYGSPALAGDVASGTVFSKILYALGSRKSTGDADEDCAIWHHHPHDPKPSIPALINRRFVDISKSGIDRAHRRVFGRALCVQPREIEMGQHYVVKSEANALHDGRIKLGRDITGEDLGPGTVIQRLIDNRIDENFVRDIRVPVIGGTIPFVYVKRRPITIRFSNANVAASITRTANVLSDKEVADIRAFCRETGFEYGELDVLRHNADQSLWIVDANNTPAGPPNGLTRAEMNFAIREMALAFQAEFLAGKVRAGISP
jgi:hypothetical protein